MLFMWKNAKLITSHIIPHFVVSYTKTQKFRSGKNPNLRKQDITKVKMLCNECEQLFSKYEKYFNEEIYEKYLIPQANQKKDFSKIDYDKLNFFILSISWRLLCYQFIFEKEKFFSEFSIQERNKIESVYNDWKTYLLNEDFININKINQYIISNLSINNIFLQNYNKLIIYSDTFTLDDEDSFVWFPVIIIIPYVILISSIWGEEEKLSDFKKINLSPITTEIKTLDSFFKKIEKDLKKAYNNLSEKQKKIIHETYKDKNL